MKYRLIKDLPGVKAGYIFEECYGEFYDSTYVDKSYATGSPDFFEPITETPKKPKTVWDLGEGNEYWFLYQEEINESEWNCSDLEHAWRRVGDIFLTKEEAERELSYRKAKTAILKHHAENSNFEPDWRDKSEERYAVTYDYCLEKLITGCWMTIGIPSVCFFATKEEAQQSIREMEKEWKVIFNVK